MNIEHTIEEPNSFEEFQDSLGSKLAEADHFYIVHYCKKHTHRNSIL